MKYVIRLDVEVEADDQEGVGDLINQLATCGLDVVLPEHLWFRRCTAGTFPMAYCPARRWFRRRRP